MDVLTDALAAMRVGQTRSARTEVHAPWGLRFPRVGGTTFHVLLRGRCWLLPPEGEAVEMAVGDVTLLRHGSSVSLADDPSTPVQDFRPAAWRPGQTIGRVDVEGPGERSLLICGAYQLGRTRPHPLLAQLPELLLLRASETPGLAATVTLLGEELEQARPGQDGVVPALVDALLLLILRGWIERSARDDAALGWPGALTDPAIGTALTHLHDDPGHAWTVAELGDRAGLSRSAFAQRFTTLVGEPPLTYLTWWRMTMAGRLLRESDAPLSAVALRVGYSSEFAFAKAFKREFGIAPGRYRREARTDEAA
ncbi:AraC-like DNA-binding protein [Catenulispora sp. EB89]|uniref:AraC family transcriptional regulator n=1 Tax=Catenulispora sp. EB89 TaxID=3156257 RepID=UPI003517398B